MNQQPTYGIVDRSSHAAWWTGTNNIWSASPQEAKRFISMTDALTTAFMECPAPLESYEATPLPRKMVMS